MKIKFLASAVVLLVCGSVGFGSENESLVLTERDYLRPAEEIAEVITAPRYNNQLLENLSPDGERYVVGYCDSMPQLKFHAKPFYILAEKEIDPKANRHRGFTINLAFQKKVDGIDLFNRLELFEWQTGNKVQVKTPKGAVTVSNASFSPDGKMLAYFAHFEDGTYIYVADAKSGKSKRLTKRAVLATHVTDFQWTADSKNILSVLVPKGRGKEPAKPEIAESPMLGVTKDGYTPTRTYQFLLKSPHDGKLLEYYSTGQIALVNARNGKIKNVGEPGMYLNVNINPSGEYLRVRTLQKPFSYIVPLGNFGKIEQLWNIDGQVLAELENVPLNEVVSGAKSNVRDYSAEKKRPADKNKKRNLIWAPDGDGMIYFSGKLKEDANDPNDPNDPNELKQDSGEKTDCVVRWVAPFGPNDVEVLYSQKNKLSGFVKFSHDFKTLFLKESKNKYNYLFAVRLENLPKKHVITKAKSSSFYSDPGELMTMAKPFCRDIAMTSGEQKYVYLKGMKYSKDPMKDAPQPFIDRVAIEDSKDKSRVFESSKEVYERVTDVLDADFDKLMVSRETSRQVPNSFLLDRATGSLKQLTNNIDHTPEITNVRHERFQVTNVDGHKFWTDVYLPVNWDPNTEPPAIFWFYPRDYSNQKSYDNAQRRYNKNQFTRLRSLRSVKILTKLGYALVETDCPYFGIAKKAQANDMFIPEMRNNLWALINELDRRGLADRERLAIGGHSFGAFGAANALMHTPFFKAAIAGDGNYNRTLTPNGFQAERRQFWEAKEAYMSVSALVWANQAHGALLMYHGLKDRNTGTWAMHADRMFQVMDTLNKRAAKYIYPYEDHGSETEQTLLDLWARMIEWLDMHVKNYEAPEIKVENL